MVTGRALSQPSASASAAPMLPLKESGAIRTGMAARACPDGLLDLVLCLAGSPR